MAEVDDSLRTRHFHLSLIDDGKELTGCPVSYGKRERSASRGPFESNPLAESERGPVMTDLRPRPPCLGPVRRSVILINELEFVLFR